MISSLCSGRLEVAKDIRKNGVTVPRGGRPQCVTCQYRSDRLEANMSGTGDLVISSCFPPQTHQQRMDHGFPYQQHRHPRVLANQESLALPLHCTRTIPPSTLLSTPSQHHHHRSAQDASKASQGAQLLLLRVITYLSSDVGRGSKGRLCSQVDIAQPCPRPSSSQLQP